MNRGRIALGLFASMLALLGCGHRDTFRVDPGGEGALVVARYERKRATGTETLTDILGHEVTETSAGGTFRLEARPGGSVPLVSEVVTRITVSRPGHFVYSGPLSGPSQAGTGASVSEDGVFTLGATTSFREERRALTSLKRSVDGVCAQVEDAACAVVEQHLEAREAYLRETWPQESEAAERWATRQGLEVLVPSWRVLPGVGLGPEEGGRLLALATLADGGLAAVQERVGQGRDLVILDASGAVSARTPLSQGGGAAALARDGEGLAVIDAGAIARFDAAGEHLGDLPLLPTPARGDLAHALHLTPEGALVAIRPSGAPVELRLYDGEGRLVDGVPLQDLVEVYSLHRAPDGATLAHGILKPPPDQGLTVAGYRVQAPRRGLVRVPGWRDTQTRLIEGVDAVVTTPDGTWSYVGAAYAPEDAAEVRSGSGSLLHQVLLRSSWEGEILETRDVSDHRVQGTDLRLAEAPGGRLVLYAADQAMGTGTDVLEAPAP